MLPARKMNTANAISPGRARGASQRRRLFSSGSRKRRVPNQKRMGRRRTGRFSRNNKSSSAADGAWRANRSVASATAYSSRLRPANSRAARSHSWESKYQPSHQATPKLKICRVSKTASIKNTRVPCGTRVILPRTDRSALLGRRRLNHGQVHHLIERIPIRRLTEHDDGDHQVISRRDRDVDRQPQDAC